jgi:hypothetical protein
MLIGAVVHDEVKDDADAALLGFASQLREVTEVSQGRVDPIEVTDVVAAVATGTWIDRVEP